MGKETSDFRYNTSLTGSDPSFYISYTVYA